jgi:RNA polymerase sigma-70 factor (ECF subfamily)
MSQINQTEQELVERAQNGDRHAQSKIVAENERMVYNVALRLLANEDEAECVLQETFLKVFQSLSEFKGQSALSTWIYRIATNYALMRIRSHKKRTENLDDIESKIDHNTLAAFNRSIGNNPLRAVMNEELRLAMDKDIGALPDKFRSVFVLKDIDGYSLKEISEMLDMSLPAVKTNLHRARLFLRNRLAKFIETEMPVSDN